MARFSVPDFCRINKDLIYLKLLVFFVHGAVYASMPFLPIFMLYMKLSAREIFLISSIVPISSCIGPVVIGCIIDRVGRFRIALGVILATSIVLHTLLLMVPEGVIVHEPMKATFNCHSFGSVLSTNICGYHGKRCPLDDWPGNVSFTFKNCDIFEKPQETSPTSKRNICFWQDYLESEAMCFNYDGQVFSNIVASTEIHQRMSACDYHLHAMNFDKFYDGLRCKPEDLQCDVDVVYPERSSVHCDKFDNEYGPTFWVCLFLLICVMFFIGAAISMTDAAILLKIKPYGGFAKYGRQRSFGYVAATIFIPLSEITVKLVDKNMWPNSPLAFFPMFILFFVALLAAVIVAIRHFADLVEPSPDLGAHHLWQTAKSWDATLFLIAILVIGFQWGADEIFMFYMNFSNQYWRPLSTAQGPSEFGFAVATSRSYGAIICTLVIPLIDRLFEKVGQVNVLAVSFGFYALMPFIELFSYSAIINVVIDAVVKAAIVTYAASLSTDHSHIFTIQGLVYGLSSGIGMSSGAWFADSLILNRLQVQLILMVLSATAGLIYWISFCLLVTRRKSSPHAGAPLDSNTPHEIEIDAVPFGNNDETG